jgi:hypothetical protein
MAALAARSNSGFGSPLAAAARGLLAATALSSPRGKFDNFGAMLAVRRANDTPLHNAMERVSENMEFGVTEARRRLNGFLTGKVRIKSIGGFVTYLTNQLMTAQTRMYDDGKAANYLVDAVSGKAILAATVDRRLSVNGLKKIFPGASITGEATRRAALVRKDPGAVVARNLQVKLSSVLRGKGRELPFSGWDEFAFTLRSVDPSLRYSIQGGRGYFGKEFGVSSRDPAENLRLIADARKRGIKLVVPALTAQLAREGYLLPGMPILVRGQTAQAEMVDSMFAHGALKHAFKTSLADFAASRLRSADQRPMPTSNVVPMVKVRKDEFLENFAARPASTSKPVPQHQGGFGGVAAPVGTAVAIRRTLNQEGREYLTVHDIEHDTEVAIAVRAMPPGLYRKEDSYGIEIGWIRVDEEGSLRHFNNEMQSHNEVGPAFDPAPNSAKRAAWALDGRDYSPEQFRDQIYLREAEVGAEGGQPMPMPMTA